MTTEQYPRSPKEQLGGIAHLGRLFDKIRMRNAGLIQDYNYLTVGFDLYLLNLLEISGEDLEQRVLAGGTDEELVAWIQANGRTLTDQDRTQWNDRIANGAPQNEAAQQRFEARRAEVGTTRGLSEKQLSQITRWVDIIEWDEGRM
ncbi:MAG: DUF5069 domain-containing protein [Nitrospirae bacterium]|jgi:hypothetical protein|nr:DUF5069 domain-containing protein [Nitrospirota bacterium]